MRLTVFVAPSQGTAVDYYFLGYADIGYSLKYACDFPKAHIIHAPDRIHLNAYNNKHAQGEKCSRACTNKHFIDMLILFFLHGMLLETCFLGKSILRMYNRAHKLHAQRKNCIKHVFSSFFMHAQNRFFSKTCIYI